MFIYKTLSRVEVGNALRHRLRCLVSLDLLLIEELAQPEPRSPPLLCLVSRAYTYSGEHATGYALRKIFNIIN